MKEVKLESYPVCIKKLVINNFYTKCIKEKQGSEFNMKTSYKILYIKSKNVPHWWDYGKL